MRVNKWVIYVFILTVVFFMMKQFDEELELLLVSFLYPHSIEWHGICVEVPRDYIIKKDQYNNTIYIAEYKTIKTNVMKINQIDLSKSDQNQILDSIKKINYIEVTNQKRINFKGCDSFQMELKDLKSNDILILMYIFSKNMGIELRVKQYDDLNKFEKILDKIMFCETKGSGR